MLLKRFKKIRKKSLVKNVNNIKTTDTSDLVKKKLTITQNLMKLNKKARVISILLLKNLYINGRWFSW